MIDSDKELDDIISFCERQEVDLDRAVKQRTESANEFVEKYRDYVGGAMFMNFATTLQDVEIMTPLLHRTLLLMKDTPQGDVKMQHLMSDFQDVSERQKNIEDFYRKHKRGLDWAERLQSHTPDTERKWWKFWEK